MGYTVFYLFSPPGADRFISDIEMMIGHKSKLWRIVLVAFWKVLSPATLLVGDTTEINTVPTFNSYTKFMGIPVKIHDRKSDCHRVSWAWMPG